MIPVTKEEAKLLRELYPEYKVTRTMVQDSKRHHYYATEHEGMMRAIASTNYAAAEIVARIDKESHSQKAFGAPRLNMADFERRERFENAVIDMKDLTITEFTDNETRCYDLMSLLKRWDGVVGITLTIERKVPLPPDGRDDV